MPRTDVAMLAAGAGTDEAQKYIEHLRNGSTAVVACHNSPADVTISGDKTAILKI